MNTNARRANWAIHAVSIAIAALVVFSFATVFYSAYVDYRGISNNVDSPQYHSVSRSFSGKNETVSVSLTIPNDGIYPITVSVSCPEPDAVGGITCEKSTVTVPAGGERELLFQMTVGNVDAFENAMSQNINGTVTIQLAPFASISVEYNLGALVEAEP